MSGLAPDRASLQGVMRTGARALAAAGIAGSALDARVLVLEAAGVSLEAYLAEPGRALAPSVLARARGFLARRAAREPVAHILGRREFFGRSFATGPGALVPRPDSETLIEAVLARIDRAAPLRILDFGTGTGCLLLTLLAECPQAEGVGVDRSMAALALAQVNAKALGLDFRARFVCGDWGRALGGHFDAVISNPPYIPRAILTGLEPEVREHDPVIALDGGPSGLDAYRAVSPDMTRLLAPGGLAALELGVETAAGAAELLCETGLSPAGVVADLAGRPRVALAQKMARDAQKKGVGKGRTRG